MLIEEKPEAFASPELIHEDHSNKKKKNRKNKKKNTENLVQPNEQSQLQVFSEPLVVESIQELKSNGESSILLDSNGVSLIKKKKGNKKKKILINAQSNGEESNESKPSLELDNREVEMIEVSGEGETVVTGKKKKKKKKRGVVDEVVVVENALNHDFDQNESGVDGGQSNEQNIISVETAVQTPILDMEVPTKESNETNLSLELENREVEMIQVSGEGATVETGKKKRKTKKKKRGIVDEGMAVENALDHNHDQNESGVDGGQSNEQNIILAETVVQTPILDMEVTTKEPTISLSTDAANVVEPEKKFSERKKRKGKRKGEHKSDGEEKTEEHNGKPLEAPVQRVMELTTEPSTDPTILMEPPPAIAVEVEQKIAKKKGKRVKKGERKSDGEEKPNEYNGTSLEIPVQRPMEPITEPITDSIILMDPHPAASIDAEKMTAKKYQRKKKGDRKSGGEEKTNECNGKLLEASVQRAMDPITESSTDPTILLDPHPHLATTMDAELKTGKKNRKRKKGDSKSDVEDKPNEHNGKSPEIPVQRPLDPMTESSMEPPILPDPNPATTIDGDQIIANKHKKRRKGAHKNDGEEKSSEHNGKALETPVQRPMDPITEPCTNPAILTEPHLTTIIGVEPKTAKKHKKREKKGDNKSDGEEKPNENNGKSLEIPVQRLMDPMTEPSMEPTILPDPHTATGIGGEQNVANKHKRKRKGARKNGEEEKPSEDNGKALETPVQRPMDPITEPSTNPAILTEPHLTTSIGVEQKIAKKHKKREKKGDNKSDGEEKPNQHNDKSLELPVQRLMNPMTEPSMEPTTLPDPHPATTIDGEQNVANKRKRKRKGARKNDEEEKPSEDNGKALETPVQIPMDPITKPSTNPAILTEPHTASFTFPIADSTADFSVQGTEFTTEHNGKLHETLVQQSLYPITAPSTDPVDPAILTVPHTASFTFPIADSTAGFSVQGTEFTTEHNGKLHETLVQQSLYPITAPSTDPVDPAIMTDPHTASFTFPIADSTAEFSVQGTEFTIAHNDQPEIGAMICWACRQPDHTIQQCLKLKYLSMNEEVCFFCGEIGHSLGRCSVHIAGGGRLARCFFCDAYGHFCYNCPGNGQDPKELWPWKLKGKFGVKVANV